MNKIVLNDIVFEYWADKEVDTGEIINIYYQNETLELYYSTYLCDAQEELEIINAIKEDFKTRKIPKLNS